jgi:hypothetical protein
VPRLDLGAPSIHYDNEEGYYYQIGGGSITAGPVHGTGTDDSKWISNGGLLAVRRSWGAHARRCREAHVA